MKTCPYCGKAYPDDVLSCSTDGELLVGVAPQPLSGDNSAEKTASPEIHLTFPEYRWSARDAWKCLGFIFVLQFVLGVFYFVLKSHFPALWQWLTGGFGSFCRALLHYGIFLTTAAFFARTETLKSFWNGFGLDRKPTEYVWWGILWALAIRFFGHFLYSHGWGNGVSNYDIHAFRITPGPERYFFLMPVVLLAPLFEEPIYRGFLYKAFRGSYSMPVSSVLIIAWTCYSHRNQYSNSLVAAFDLSLLTIVQCYLREKSASLWDCIFCHAAFNGSLLFIGRIPV